MYTSSLFDPSVYLSDPLDHQPAVYINKYNAINAQIKRINDTYKTAMIKMILYVENPYSRTVERLITNLDAEVAYA